MALTKEIDLGRISEDKQEHLEESDHLRDGQIPGWDEVVVKFELEGRHPRDFQLFMDYYLAQRRIAEGRNKKARNKFRGLDANPDYVSLEKKEGTLLTSIAKFVRGENKRRR